MYQIDHLVAENNIYDGYVTDHDSWIGPVGLTSIGYEGAPPHIFPQMIFRNNLCRHIDNGPDLTTDTGGYGLAVRITSTENAIIEGNVIGFGSPHLLHDLWSRNITAFNNLGPAGRVVHAAEDLFYDHWRQHDDLETRIEDALLLAF